MNSRQKKNTDWSLCVGFFFVLIITISSINTMVNWLISLNVSKPIMVLLGVVGVVIWICGLVFLYHAERSVFSNQK